MPLQPQGSRAPFFCVHPAAGSPLCYVNLAAHLGTEQPFYGFQSPGLLDGREPLESVQELARLYVDSMRSWYPSGRYLIGAWSSGGPVAFEMARILERDGHAPALLALFDCGLMKSDNPMRGSGLIARLRGLMTVAGFVAHVRVPRSYKELRHLGQVSGVSLPPALRDFLRGLVRPSFLRRFAADILHSLKIFQINTAAGLHYQPAPYNGKVTLFRTGRRSAESDPVLIDLRDFAQGGVDLLEVEGNHMSIILDPEVSGLLAIKVKQVLERHNKETR
jgi:thioesterase domain-containing protein